MEYNINKLNIEFISIDWNVTKSVIILKYASTKIIPPIPFSFELDKFKIVS